MGNTINLYDTRTMLQAIEIMMPAKTFLRDTFFGRTEVQPTEHLDFDYQKGKRKMAPFVAPRVGGIVMDRQGFVTRSLSVPLVAPDRVMTVDDISKRGFGEAVYSSRTPEERANDLLAKDLIDLDDYITRREEWMCREALLKGKVDCSGIVDEATGAKVDQQVDFGFTNTSVLTGNDLWSASTADIFGDLRDWRLRIIKATGKAPNVVIMASNVVDAFLKNATIQKIYDVQRFNLGVFQPRLINDAITYVTSIPSLGLEVYSYDEWFVGDDGNETAMIPDGKVIMASTNMGRRIYGAVTQIEGNAWQTYAAARVPKNWVEEKSNILKIRISSRPLPVPDNVDGWCVATVL